MQLKLARSLARARFNASIVKVSRSSERDVFESSTTFVNKEVRKKKSSVCLAI